ncbi:ATP-binding protein [Bacillus sp. FJAT-47783]|uniref:sensor histidine kinase n=1 Tax=Bacillus sp. FJAT-47783 TaxID=2922712 RepID=UPI001FAB8393|nr:ATP-binding protein [Bacillus sp. FJAT-47783]
MNIKKLSISHKVLFLFLVSFVISIVFSFLFIHFLYKDLYIRSVKEQLIYEGERTAAHFHYGSLSGEIKDKIAWYNVVSPYEVIVVDKLEKLGDHFPYQIDYEHLISKEDEQKLLNGQYVTKEGYVKEFRRNITGAIFPLTHEQKLIGFIYIYVPLAEIPEVFNYGIPILIFSGSFFFLILFFIINYFVQSIFKPLRTFRTFSKEVGRGNFSKRVHIDTSDEIGELADAFNKMAESLEEQDERKKEFLSNVAHELRTPLTYIGGYTQLLLDKAYSSEEEKRNHLLLIEKESKRMQKLIHDLLQLNELEDKKMTNEKEPIAFSQLILDSLELFTPSLTKRNITIHTNLDDEIIIMGDSSRLQQVLYNVIDNAVKYSNNNGEIRITSYQDRNRAIVKITDDGIGIPKKDIDRIGERFYRTDKSRSRKTGGTGLGLSIVKEIVALHDGTMEIESEEGKGTTVILSFPLID